MQRIKLVSTTVLDSAQKVFVKGKKNMLEKTIPSFFKVSITARLIGCFPSNDSLFETITKFVLM